MVSKNVILLSLLMPVAMATGTSIAIEFSRSSSLMLLIFSALAGLRGCVYLIIKQSEHHGYSCKEYNVSSEIIATK